MAICCLLIDTFKQFQAGILTSEPNKTVANSQSNYVNFLKKNLGDIFNQRSAEIFYKSIRCGILHSAQTKNNAILSMDNSFIVKYENKVLYVSVERFIQALYHYYILYKEQLYDKNEIEIRTCFLEKMNNIANK